MNKAYRLVVCSPCALVAAPFVAELLGRSTQGIKTRAWGASRTIMNFFSYAKIGTATVSRSESTTGTSSYTSDGDHAKISCFSLGRCETVIAAKKRFAATDTPTAWATSMYTQTWG